MHPTHESWLVLLSYILALQGSYVALHLGRQVAGAEGSRQRQLIAASAFSLALAIWTMHFVGMLAMHLPTPLDFLVLPTLLSFLACVLVSGIAIFAVSSGKLTARRLALAALLMGGGIVVMHYTGMQALNSTCTMRNDFSVVAASVVVGIGASGLALWLGFSDAARRWPAASSAILAAAICAMHYTAMAGTRVYSVAMASLDAPRFSPGTLALVVSVVAFLVSGLFLLTLIPEKSMPAVVQPEPAALEVVVPAAEYAAALPIERDGIRRTIDVDAVVAVRAQAHYTQLFDGSASWFCPLSISEVEGKLDPVRFARVHRSHIVKLDRVAGLRRAGDAAEVSLIGSIAYRVPVARAKTRWLRRRLASAPNAGFAGVAEPRLQEVRQYG